MSSSHPNAALATSPATTTLDVLARDLSTSLFRATRHGLYDHVAVLALHWENDDMGVERMEGELLRLFERTYRFTTQSYVIPLVTTQLTVTNFLDGWLRANQGERVLRIVIYSGHASAGGTRNTQWYLAGRVNHYGHLHGPRLEWWTLRGTLNDNYPGETCYIFDCCSGGSLALGDHGGGELLASCGWGGFATAQQAWSLTQVLLDTLRDLNGSPATLAQLYGIIYRRAHQNQIGASPVYIPHESLPSVTLAPLGPQRAMTRPSTARQYPQVLLSVRVRANMPHDITLWHAWLESHIPPDVFDANVTVQAAFQGSCLLLLTLPTELWGMLPHNNGAYTFVAHVNSNILTRSQQPTTMPFRPMQSMDPNLPPAGENSPPRGVPRDSSPGKRNI
ncbi:unnamed protein product [Penicillium salamii]|uniref:Uncharacterized protein n=1 Tax=Penicillium salamii TaxID=1612424 RepID=A0A9W4MYR8_9EURO|nr:unnamed protein product [Penicillium salamii]CAG8361114.1 unnamed protein product [Penicillium salamii]CAG8362540.1 unnamed protein product [Penicillium salamii]CAG8369050.1 unnamed protein product [Penicillium salamii]